MLTKTNFLTASTVARARNLLGERGEELDTLVIHPTVAYYLYQVGMLTFSTSALSTGTGIQWGGGGVGITDRSIGQFAGMNVVIDSQLIQFSSWYNRSSKRVPLLLNQVRNNS